MSESQIFKILIETVGDTFDKYKRHANIDKTLIELNFK
jgi:hypothetical protein